MDDNQLVHKGQVIAALIPGIFKPNSTAHRPRSRRLRRRLRPSTTDVPLTTNTTDSATLAAEANLTSAQAELLGARKAAEKAHNADLSVASAELADRTASYERAHADLGRMQNLIARKRSQASNSIAMYRPSGARKGNWTPRSRH